MKKIIPLLLLLSLILKGNLYAGFSLSYGNVYTGKTAPIIKAVWKVSLKSKNLRNFKSKLAANKTSKVFARNTGNFTGNAVIGVPTISYTTPNYYNLNSPIPPLTPISSGVATIAYPTTTPTALATTGASGGPWGVGVDNSGNLYVCNAKASGTTPNSVYKYTSAGAYTGVFIPTVTGPTGIAFDPVTGVAYVSTSGGFVYKYPAGGGSTPTSTFYTGGGSSSVTGIYVDAAQNVYVTDYGLKLVKEYSSAGMLLVTISSSAVLNDPSAVQVDPQGNIYVLDAGTSSVNASVQKYSSAGAYIATIAPTSGQSNPAYGFYRDKTGNFYVGDNGNNQIRMYNSSGTLLTTITSSGNITNPRGIFVDGTGTIYTTNYSTNMFFKVVPVGGYFLSGTLPTGLTFNNTTGVISGTPTANGSGTYTVSAYNSFRWCGK